MASQVERGIPGDERIAGREMNDGGDHAGAGGNRHADKIFLSGTSRIGRLRIAGDVEARQAAGSGDQKKKTGNGAKLRQFDVPLCRR